MNKLIFTALIFFAVSAVGIADVLIKKISLTAESTVSALKHPVSLAVFGLYLVQIVIFTYVFVNKVDLGVIGILQTALYAIIVLGSAVLFFGEHFTPVQIAGMALAVTGVILLNL